MNLFGEYCWKLCRGISLHSDRLSDHKYQLLWLEYWYFAGGYSILQRVERYIDEILLVRIGHNFAHPISNFAHCSWENIGKFLMGNKVDGYPPIVTEIWFFKCNFKEWILHNFANIFRNFVYTVHMNSKIFLTSNFLPEGG